jgi:hypothetical protein
MLLSPLQEEKQMDELSNQLINRVEDIYDHLDNCGREDVATLTLAVVMMLVAKELELIRINDEYRMMSVE